jgi:hypothetical protein
MQDLENSITAEADKVNEATWARLLSSFKDACVYQSWPFDTLRNGEIGTSHIVLKRREKLIAASQVRIYRIPFSRTGIAYVRWGPLWQPTGSDKDDIEVYRQAIRALRNEYVRKRGLVLRIRPGLFPGEKIPFHSVFKEEGYAPVLSEDKKRTLIMDLTPPMEVLRKGFDPKWRNHLNRSLRNGLELVEGQDDHLFGIFLNLYDELVARKNFALPNDIHHYRNIQERLPDEHKMRIILSYSNGNLGAGAICSAIGDTGITLFRATNKSGMANGGSYLVQWRILEWAKERHCSYYNLNGINPAKNPGTFEFKSGVCGKNGRELYYPGVYDAYPSIAHKYGTRVLEFARGLYRKTPGLRGQL